MAIIQVKQMGERVATNGIYLGPSSNRLRRKLEPGERVDIPEDAVFDESDQRNILETVWETGLIEIAPDKAKPTRPLDYESEQEATYNAPSFRPMDESERILMEKSREEVANRLENQSVKRSDAREDGRKKGAAENSAPNNKRRNRRSAA